MPTLTEGKRSTVPIIVRMRATERDLLKDVLFEEGCPSMSAWLRQRDLDAVRVRLVRAVDERAAVFFFGLRSADFLA